MRTVLLASPWTGTAPWEPVAALLEAALLDVEVADPHSPRSVEDDPLPVRLVAHSGAGLYVASLLARLDVHAVVYVDAALPVPGSTSVPVVPSELAEHLRTLVGIGVGIGVGTDGLLPPWTRWWDDVEGADVEGLFPDDDGATLAWVRSQEPRLPLSHALSELPTPSGWEHVPSAYLAFGATYAEEISLAGSLGWPIENLDGGHLHQLVDPPAVADAVRRLFDRLQVPG